MIKALFFLLAGAYATSYAEYKFQYNLYDFTVDKAKALFALLKGDEGKSVDLQ